MPLWVQAFQNKYRSFVSIGYAAKLPRSFPGVRVSRQNSHRINFHNKSCGFLQCVSKSLAHLNYTDYLSKSLDKKEIIEIKGHGIVSYPYFTYIFTSRGNLFIIIFLQESEIPIKKKYACEKNARKQIQFRRIGNALRVPKSNLNSSIGLLISDSHRRWPLPVYELMACVRGTWTSPNKSLLDSDVHISLLNYGNQITKTYSCIIHFTWRQFLHFFFPVKSHVIVQTLLNKIYDYKRKEFGDCLDQHFIGERFRMYSEVNMKKIWCYKCGFFSYKAQCTDFTMLYSRGYCVCFGVTLQQ